jgi:hypothetical protein
MQKCVIIITVILFFAGCRKSELEQVPSNEPPPDHTITTVQIGNYINRTYILVLGREPDSLEYNNALAMLVDSSVDSLSRRIFLNDVFSDASYRTEVYNEMRIKLLDNMDTSEFGNYAYLFQLFLSDTSYQLQWPYYQYEVNRLNAVRNAYHDYTTAIINIEELQRRMCNNYFYDQLHMGTANFVIATFQDLVSRNATNAEEQSAVSMVDGNNAVLFLEAGASKDDYLGIMTHTSNYFEGQVIFMYQKYLGHQPTTVQMSDGTLKFMTTDDYTVVQKDILASDEFLNQ